MFSYVSEVKPEEEKLTAEFAAVAPAEKLSMWQFFSKLIFIILKNTLIIHKKIILVTCVLLIQANCIGFIMITIAINLKKEIFQNRVLSLICIHQ